MTEQTDRYQQMLNTTLEIAKEAGELIKQARDTQQLQTQYKAQKELVTSADIAADKLIIDHIQNRFPGHRILSEETFTDKEQIKDLTQPIWIIDPIDGTVNYAHGHPQVAVSIAYAENGEVQFGVVHNPFAEETFSGLKGGGSGLKGGAWLNGNPIQVSGLDDFSTALIATGFPYDKTQREPILKRLQVLLTQCQDLRRLGSAALDICWVACGRLDGYFESLSPWDFAAARLIALEAGATCGHFSPVPDEIPACIYNNDIVISTPGIYQPLNDLLKSTQV